MCQMAQGMILVHVEQFQGVQGKTLVEAELFQAAQGTTVVETDQCLRVAPLVSKKRIQNYITEFNKFVIYFTLLNVNINLKKEIF